MMYDNATKQTWRGWAWNQVKKRTYPGSTVLALCGDSGLDYSVGTKKGFEVVGVDINQSKVDTFRELGGVAVCDKVHRQILTIKPSSAVIDMMGGMSAASFTTPVLAAFSICDSIVWNGLRGRDTIGGLFGDECSSWIAPDYSRGRVVYGTKTGLHRGKLAWWWLCVFQYKVFEFGVDSVNPLIEQRDREIKIPAEFITYFAELTRPEFYSYRSKDSVGSVKKYDSLAINCLGDHKSRSSFKLEPSNALKRKKILSRSVRKAAAAKAILTRRRSCN